MQPYPATSGPDPTLVNKPCRAALLLLNIALPAALLVSLLMALLSLAAGELLSRPARAVVGAAPADLQAESVRLTGADYPPVSGWLLRGRPSGGAVLLLHGVRSNRLQMLARARFLKAAGYSVLLIDLPAHGESAGERISFGLREAYGVRAALQHLRSALPGERIGVVAVSLGAASLLFAKAEPVPDAVVLESMYATIDEAVSNRMAIRFGTAGRHLAPLLLWQLPWRLNITAEQLRPIALLPGLAAPLLIASGSEDRQTPIEETRRLFAAAAGPGAKTLWEVPGAAHVDLHAFSAEVYESRLLAFLGEHLRGR